MPHEGPHKRKRPADEGPAYGVYIHLRKEKINKINKMTQEILLDLTFKVNNHTQDGKKGSAAECFLWRKPKNLLSNSMEREVDWRTMLDERQKESSTWMLKHNNFSYDYPTPFNWDSHSWIKNLLKHEHDKNYDVIFLCWYICLWAFESFKLLFVFQNFKILTNLAP